MPISTIQAVAGNPKAIPHACVAPSEILNTATGCGAAQIDGAREFLMVNQPSDSMNKIQIVDP